MMTMATDSPLRSPERTPALATRGQIRRLRIVKRDESFSLIFFIPEREYMELELRSVEVQGAHKVGWRAPHPCGQGVGPFT